MVVVVVGLFMFLLDRKVPALSLVGRIIATSYLEGSTVPIISQNVCI